MKKIALIVSAAAAFAATPASAATYLIDFSGTNLFGGQPLVGSATLTTSDTVVRQNNRDALKILSISGTYNGSAITGLNPTVFGADNFYYLSGNFASGNGIGFNTAAGTNANLFTTTGSRYRLNSQNPFRSGFVTATSQLVPVAAAVPEPATWMMMLFGFGLIGFGMRSAKRRSDEKFETKIRSITYGVA